MANVQPVCRWTGRAIGLDLHRDFCEIAICEEGVTHSAGRAPMTPEGIEALADSLGPTDRVVMEVSSAAWEVARRWRAAASGWWSCPLEDTGIAQARAKTDKLDSRTLASLLSRGELEAVWTPDDRVRVLRRRLHRREQLVRARTRAKNEVHAVLMRTLQGKRPCSDMFGVKAAAGSSSCTGSWRSRRPRRLSRHSDRSTSRLRDRAGRADGRPADARLARG